MRDVKQLTEATRRQDAGEKIAVKQPVRTSDRAGKAQLSFGLLRHVGTAVAYAQTLSYDNQDSPVEGAISTTGGWFEVYPTPGAVYDGLKPFVTKQVTVSGATITTPAEYDAAIASGSADPLVSQVLGIDNVLAVKVYDLGTAKIVEVALDMPAAAVVDDSIQTSGGSSP